MSGWDELFGEQEHILHEADIFAIHFARILKNRQLKRVLDWGCGAGRHVLYLAGRGFEVSGMDPSERGIKLAQERLASEGLSAELQVAEPGSIPTDDASYDAVLSMYAIEHGLQEDVRRSVSEILRVLRSGGLTLITLSSGEDSMKLMGQQVAQGTYVPEAGPEAGIPHYLTTRTDIEVFFAGFDVLELTHVCSRLDSLSPEDPLSAHWVVIARKA